TWSPSQPSSELDGFLSLKPGTFRFLSLSVAFSRPASLTG
ncbi:hypothetical protein A2U01_0052729, partial [Trifolium medium]|nr:hypothetical protein [Trifolium medium]